MSSTTSTSSSADDDGPLQELVEGFAAELTHTVQLLVPDCAPFVIDAGAHNAGSQRVSVRQRPDTGIALCVHEEPILNLKVIYRCSLDHQQRFLAVDSSEIVVRARGSSEPLFRFDFVRNPTSSDVPCAHIQVHAHRDAITYAMSKAGSATPRGRRRARATDVPTLSELHLPVGGRRFRPCLEDVLEVLVNEFGVDSTDDGLAALRLGREGWRRLQLAAAIRDAPENAAEALRSLGYSVSSPATGALPDHIEKLRAL